MATTIPLRELRNNNVQIIDRVTAGEAFVVTRNGVPVADVMPHVETRKPPRFRSAQDASARTRLSRAEAERWLDEVAAAKDSHGDARDPWERAERRG